MREILAMSGLGALGHLGVQMGKAMVHPFSSVHFHAEWGSRVSKSWA